MSNLDYIACPTDIVAALFEIVWQLLTDFSGWGRFFDVRVVSVNPPGLAIPGQRMVGKTGSRWLPMKASFEFTLIDEPNGKLELNVELPFGIAVHESLDCVRIDGVRCRVNYHCHFGLPVGWRGSLLRRLIGKGFEHGPADSLRRLKDAAEQVYRRRISEGTRPDNRGV